MLKKIFLLAMILLIAVAVGGCISQTPEEADWNRAQENFTINALEEFLTAYPNGTYAAEAKANIKSLKKAEKPYQFIERIKGN